MNKEDLLELKKRIAGLSENEKQARDIYLKKIASGEIQGPSTGYPSIDKPSLAYYRSEPVKEINTNQTMYNMVFNQEDMNATALGYMGKNWSFEDLKLETDKCADALKKIGIKKGDVVLLGVSNSLETISTVLAINKIGAVSKFFDLRASNNDIKKYANISNCKYMFSQDIILPKVSNVLSETSLEKVIVIDSNIGINYDDIIDNDSIKKYEDFIKVGIIDREKCVEFDKNRPSLMIQSSGTTGKPKTIIHSDYSITNMTKSFSYFDTPLGKEKIVLSALPPWIAYGIIDSMITPLALGSKVELCPNFEPDAIFKYIGQFTMVFAAPFHYRYISEHYDELSQEQKEQLKKVECMVTGGDKISVEENKAFEELFGTSLTNGYGNNEGLGCLTLNPKINNKYGTVGISKYNELIISYDNENKMELQYGQIGEICSLANTQFIGYENNEEETKKSKVLHDDNRNWLHTGDLGFIDSEGYIHLVGRSKRVIIRLGFKISAYTIEDNLSTNDCVKECVVVSVKDDQEEHVPMAFVVIKDEYKEKENVIETILNNCYETLKENEIPKYIEIVEELPYTQNGKYDFKKLEEIGNEFVENLSNNNRKILKK